MENSPRRSLPLNLNISDIFFGPFYPPISNLVYTGQKMFPQDLKASSKSASLNMSHSTNMDDSAVNSGIKKANRNTFFQGMAGVFDSITNMVSKISNYTSALNNTLSVTVVPNEDIVSSCEFFLRNLTANNQDSSSSNDNFTKIFGNTTNKTIHDVNNHITQVFTAHQLKNFKLVNTESTLSKDPIDHFYDEEGYKNLLKERSDLELAIEESLKHMKNYNPCNKTDLDCPNLKKELEKNNLNLLSKNNNISMESLKYISLDESDAEEQMELDNLVGLETEVPVKKSISSKMRRKSNTVARCRGKGRNKIQLRKSGVSQSKHRKERIKQNIYSNIQEDLNAWEIERNDSEEQSSIISSTIDDENKNKNENMYEMEIEYSTLIESFRLGDLITIREKQQEKSLENSNYSSNDLVSTFNNESRRLSQCSIDSDDSCFIVFEDESADEDESTDYSDESTDSEKDEDEELDKRLKSNLQVRFDLKPTIHTIIKWDYAYRAARKGPWEEFARDRDRFRGKINCISQILEPILTKKHRDYIWKNRFAIIDESM